MAILAGKTALVTGASRGIGRASALALAPPAPRFSCITAAARRKPTLSSQRYAKAVAERMR